ncbi:MAG: hypothetical protein LC808_30250 [Actinobacteria bacterium]|nr:hypothetical protein [Actinomycetota bacterium]
MQIQTFSRDSAEPGDIPERTVRVSSLRSREVEDAFHGAGATWSVIVDQEKKLLVETSTVVDERIIVIPARFCD